MNVPPDLSSPPTLCVPSSLDVPSDLGAPQPLTSQDLSSRPRTSVPPTDAQDAPVTIPTPGPTPRPGPTLTVVPDALAATSDPPTQRSAGPVVPARPPRRSGQAGRSGRAPSGRLVAAALAALAVIAVVNDDDSDRQTGTDQPFQSQDQAGVAPNPAADGMPIPGGNAPVEAVRIVLQVGDRRLPARERRDLADWLAQTQHADTRIRLVRGRRVTPPLSPTGVRNSAAADRTLTHAVRWLNAGERRAVDGGWITVNASRGPRGLTTQVDRLTVAWTSADAQVRRRAANRIARKIMVVSDQRFDGTSTP